MGAKRFIGSVADVPTTDTSLDEHRSAVSEAEIVKSNWSNAARRMTKYQHNYVYTACRAQRPPNREV